MDREFEFVDTGGQMQRVRATDADTAMRTATNIAPNSGVIAVDTLSRQADPNVERGVEIVNSQSIEPTQGLQQVVGQTVASIPPMDTRQALMQSAQSMLERDVRGERQQVREDLQISDKEERARTLSNQLIQRQRQQQDQIERMEKNPLGQSEFALNARLNRMNREFARENADLSFGYNVALGDYQAAEKIASEYMSDIQAEFQSKQQAWQMLYTLFQNDMTESEKLQAQQAHQEKMMQEQFEISKKMASFESGLRREEQASAFARQTSQQQALMNQIFQGPQVSFEDYVKGVEEEMMMSLDAPARERLRAEYNQLSATQQRQQVAQAVAIGAMSPQQAEFVQKQMNIDLPAELSAEARMIVDNPTLLDKYTPTERGRLLNEIANAGGVAETAAQAATLDMVDRALTSIDNLLDIKTPTGRLLSLNPFSSRESGESGLRRITGFTKLNPMNLIPGTAGKNAKAQLQTVKDILTLPSLEFAQGIGRMNQDIFNTLKSASQTLETDMSDGMMMLELNRMRDALNQYKDQAEGRGASSLPSENDYQEYLNLIYR